MKTFKKFLLGLAIVLLAMLVTAFFLPRQVHVERKGTINAPAKVVFNQVNNLHTWEKWAVWNQMDPDMQVEFEHTGIGKGAAYTWESENPNLGSGKLTITESVPYDSIATKMNFMEEGISTGYLPLERGSRQGDPISAYIIIMEIFSTTIKANQNINALEILGFKYHLTSYADDTTFL